MADMKDQVCRMEAEADLQQFFMQLDARSTSRPSRLAVAYPLAPAATQMDRQTYGQTHGKLFYKVGCPDLPSQRFRATYPSIYSESCIMHHVLAEK